MRFKGETVRVAILALLVTGCAQHTTPPSGNEVDVAPGDGGATTNPASFRKLTLERTACFGACPVYRVTVYADGRVLYEGKQWVGAPDSPKK